MKLTNVLLIFAISCILLACHSRPDGKISKVANKPAIDPDYSALTIPVNIAPLNFSVKEKGESFYVKILAEKGGIIEISSKSGIIKIPEEKWKELLAENADKKLTYKVFVKKQGVWNEYEPFTNTVSASPVSPFLYYRILYPGYESWSDISIIQRSLESFDEKVVIDNNVVNQNCVNCHAMNLQNSGEFMFHMRGSMGGTYIVSDGELKKFNLKTKEMENGATYPRWHPSGKFIAFSSNKVVQQFHSSENKKIEVSDLASTLVLYDLAKNEMFNIETGNDQKFMDTYPEWSPDGSYLYFCRAEQIGKQYNYQDIKYNLCRMHFNLGNRRFGEVETIFDAAAQGKSASFPRISPDGNFLVFTLHDFGCFPIWHKEADLYSINLKDMSCDKMNVNSEFTESYHSWSANGRWLIFSSKRGDGLTARPYFSFIDENGVSGKTFVLPQEDPEFYSRFLKTFNIPELAESDFTFTPGEIREAAEKEPVQAKGTTY